MIFWFLKRALIEIGYIFLMPLRTFKIIAIHILCFHLTSFRIPYITGASNFNDGTIELIRWTPNPQVITHYGDLLITCKGTIGEMGFNNFGDAHIARQIMAIRNTFNLNSEFLSYCICFYINSIKASAKGIIPGISREDILNLILPIPPSEYQEQVVAYIRKVNVLFDSLEKSLN